MSDFADDQVGMRAKSIAKVAAIGFDCGRIEGLKEAAKMLLQHEKAKAPLINVVFQIRSRVKELKRHSERK